MHYTLNYITDLLLCKYIGYKLYQVGYVSISVAKIS